MSWQWYIDWQIWQLPLKSSRQQAILWFDHKFKGNLSCCICWEAWRNGMWDLQDDHQQRWHLLTIFQNCLARIHPGKQGCGFCSDFTQLQSRPIWWCLDIPVYFSVLFILLQCTQVDHQFIHIPISFVHPLHHKIVFALIKELQVTCPIQCIA